MVNRAARRRQTMRFRGAEARGTSREPAMLMPEAPVDISDRTPIHFFCAPPSCRLIVPESIYIIQSQDGHSFRATRRTWFFRAPGTPRASQSRSTWATSLIPDVRKS